MKNETRNAYDTLSSDYHLMYPDWQKAVRKQGKALQAVIRGELLSKKAVSILDCSCGVGTQALGLALRGCRVLATDLSPKAVAQARKNARKMKARLSFGVADFRKLARQVPGRFDAVIACDNSLPHLTTEKEILLAAKNIRAKLNPKGVFILGVRDYDAFLPARAPGVGPFYMKNGLSERVYLRSWEWEKNRPVYKFRLFILKGKGLKWKASCVISRYRAWKRQELSKLFLKAGFASGRWLMPKESKFHQPLGIFI